MPLSHLDSAVTSWRGQMSGCPLAVLTNCPTERQFCDDERTSAHRRRTWTAGCRPWQRRSESHATATGSTAFTGDWRSAAASEGPTGQRTGRLDYEHYRPSPSRTRLNYLPRSHAHVDSRCILMLHGRLSGHLFAGGRLGKRHPQFLTAIVGNQSQRYNFLPRRINCIHTGYYAVLKKVKHISH